MQRDELPIIKIKPFDFLDFYSTGIDETTQTSGKADHVKLTYEGVDLSANYYADKYHMEHVRHFSNSVSFIDDIQETKLKDYTGEDRRIPFVFNSLIDVRITQSTSSHSSPAVLVHEGGKSAIIYFDSLGDTKVAKELAEKTGMQVYTIPVGRQVDFYSCHTDAMVFLRELAGKDDQGKWLMPNLLSRLEVVQPGNPATVKMPDKLRITTQIPINTDEYEKDPAIVHRGKQGEETYAQFRKRYPETVPFKPIQPASGYLRQKGFKMANIIEIQFYVEQLHKLLGSEFTETKRQAFIKAAKAELKSQGPMTSLNLRTRKGLKEFTENYVPRELNLEWQKALSLQSSSERKDIHSTASPHTKDTTSYLDRQFLSDTPVKETKQEVTPRQPQVEIKPSATLSNSEGIAPTKKKEETPDSQFSTISMRRLETPTDSPYKKATKPTSNTFTTNSAFAVDPNAAVFAENRIKRTFGKLLLTLNQKLVSELKEEGNTLLQEIKIIQENLKRDLVSLCIKSGGEKKVSSKAIDTIESAALKNLSNKILITSSLTNSDIYAEFLSLLSTNMQGPSQSADKKGQKTR